MTCTITPRTTGSIDADRHPAITWGTPATGVPCRLAERDERTIVNSTQAGSVRYDKRLMVGPTTAVKPFDRVTAIATGNGTDDGPYQVEDVLDRRGVSLAFRTVLLSRLGGAR